MAEDDYNIVLNDADVLLIIHRPTGGILDFLFRSLNHQQSTWRFGKRNWKNDSTRSGPARDRNRSVPDYRHAIKKNWKFLVENLECEYGLLEALVSRGVISGEQLSELEELDTKVARKRNDKLLAIVCQQLDVRNYEDFLAALCDTNQAHLSQHIANHEASFKYKHGKDRPLLERERGRLQCLQEFLMENIRPDDVLNGLLCNGCITERQLKGINEPGSREKKVEALLEIIQRRSHAQYKKFVECLRTSHEHVARAIVNPGVVLIADAFIESPSLKTITMDIERQIVDSYFALPMTEQNKISLSLLYLSDVQLIGLQRRHSVRLYFHCSTLEALSALSHLADAGQLRISVEVFFNQLLTATKSEARAPRLRMMQQVNYWRCASYFGVVSDTDSKETFGHGSIRMELPMELWEQILLKTFAMRITKDAMSLSGPVAPNFRQLTSVRRLWWGIAIRRRWFASTLRKHLTSKDSIRAEPMSRLRVVGQVVAFAQRDDEIYLVVSCSLNQIQVYDAVTLEFLYYFELAHKSKTLPSCIEDMLAVDGDIYVGDSANDYVWQLVNTGQRELPVRHRAHRFTKIENVSNLLDAPDPGLVITGRYNLSVDENRRGVSNEFSLPRKIVPLPGFLPVDSVGVPLHAVKIAPDVYVVSCGPLNGSEHFIYKMLVIHETSAKQENDEAATDVQEVRKTYQRVQIVSSYGYDKGEKPGQLNHPAHMAVDPRGFIYVADCYNDRVLALDFRLNLRGVLLTRKENQIVRPYRLSYDRDTCQLLVGGLGYLDRYSCSVITSRRN